MVRSSGSISTNRQTTFNRAFPVPFSLPFVWLSGRRFMPWKLCRWLARKPHLPTEHVFLNMLGKPYTKDCFCHKMRRVRERADIKVKAGLSAGQIVQRWAGTGGRSKSEALMAKLIALYCRFVVYQPHNPYKP